jgi:hypothetical protein
MAHPDRGAEMGLFREEFGLYDEEGNPRELTDEEEAEWDEWWATAMEVWEEEIRHCIEQTETVTLPRYEAPEITIPVRVISDD